MAFNRSLDIFAPGEHEMKAGLLCLFLFSITYLYAIPMLDVNYGPVFQMMKLVDVKVFPVSQKASSCCKRSGSDSFSSLSS